ncbi:Kynurenine formamidase [Muriicola jejuensis]|uniref:Cyclase family protein n=1 Tax=Muriicola jejuensis TaxID=504488 RepID=A0A6P0U8Y5_9FLAO|nr:cyclase family protein [Muriicola jejuensis]NER09574.1 cyclase family protein [Muriicola jejuensis]SMP07662.1 Kynurenine formamidase [Muriicola jejuensis]
MIISFQIGKRRLEADLDKPLDISIPLHAGPNNVNAWYVGPPQIEPHREGDFTGSVQMGASTNFNDITFNPHAHGTHTECLGHITPEMESVNQTLKRFFFHALLITLTPERVGEDAVVSGDLLQKALGRYRPEALVVRTLPNTRAKLSRQYSHSNPPYFSEEAMTFLVARGVEHLLVDLPSVDREKDGGKLLAHRAFWGMDGRRRTGATITEFIFAGNDIEDGEYLLELQFAPFENDASPSRPVLYKIH